MKLKVCHKDTVELYDKARFERIFEITYLPHLEFKDWEVEQWVTKRCARAYKKNKVSQIGNWLGQFHGQKIGDDYMPDVIIQWLHEKIGYGVIADQDLNAWEYVGEYTGILRRRNFFFPNINDYCFMYPSDGMGLPLKHFTIDSQKHGNFTRFINHSDTPNCESVGVFFEGVYRIIFRTIKPIKKGTQLTYDYGGFYWNRRKKLPEDEV